MIDRGPPPPYPVPIPPPPRHSLPSRFRKYFAELEATMTYDTRRETFDAVRCAQNRAADRRTVERQAVKIIAAKFV